MTCHNCGKEKVLWAFATFRTRRGECRRRGVCKACRGLNVRKKFSFFQAYRKRYNKKNKSKKALRDAQRRAETRAYVDALKRRTPCTDCKRKFPPICMDFDHIKAKARSVANLVGGAYRLELIKEEIARCELVCACCHRLRTQHRKQNLAPVFTPQKVDATVPAHLSLKHITTIRADAAIGDPPIAIARRFRTTVAVVRRIADARNGRAA